MPITESATKIKRPFVPKRNVSGILLLDKPEGISSSGALVKARGIYRALKGGHTGSLDPLASGLLPICLGEAAKFSSYFLEGNKKYIGKVTGIVPAQDNEPEIDEISILNELDNRNYSLFENEIKSINIISK